MSVAVYRLKPELSDSRFEGWSFRKGLKSVLDPDQAAYVDFSVTNSLSVHWQCKLLDSVWRPQKAVGKVAPFNDYPCVDLNIPAYSRRAVDALRPILEPNGELLELDCPTGEYFAFNCTTKVDVLNLRKSELNRDDPEERCDDVKRYEFYKTRVKGLSIFPIPECPTQYMVTDMFKDRVEQAGLNGFTFVKLWPLPDGVSWQDEDTAQHKKKLGKLAGHTLILRLRLQGRRPTATEKRLASHIEESLAETLQVDSIKQPYQGTIEASGYEDGEFRIFCSCPDVDTTESFLTQWLSEVFWEDDFAIDKRYGHLYNQKAKEQRVMIKTVRDS